MSDLPMDLHYTMGHQWVRLEDNNVVRVGITDFAQQQLGDLVYVDLPQLGRAVIAGEQCATVESVKTASDLLSPVTGEIVAVNDALADEPEQINDAPFQAWIYSVKADDLSVLDELLDGDAYQRLIEQ